MNSRLTIVIAACCLADPQASILHVGAGRPYADLRSAAAVAQPGDTVLLHGGVYAGGQWIENLKGRANAWITILAAPGESVVFDGGSEACHFVDPAFVHIRGITFLRQSGNGVNCDDGGTYATPARQVIFDSCTWRDMDAAGNNDQLKLSGLDSFEVRNCTFINGAAGGSGIDMVGCHNGLIIQNRFENQGSNSIQAKGGAQHIRIERNLFIKGGQRTLNLGGSTGLQFFRPMDAPFEAADLQVASNIFIDCHAPIAYVGCVRVDVAYNTIIRPQNWVIRILQETVDVSRFAPCGDGSFRNNIIYLGNGLSTECNVGPNTALQTFTFARNLWFNYQNAAWAGPRNLPVAEQNPIIGKDPLFVNVAGGNFRLAVGSPAIDSGQGAIADDFDGRPRDARPDIGAFEYAPASAVSRPSDVGLWGAAGLALSDVFTIDGKKMSRSIAHGRRRMDDLRYAPGLHVSAAGVSAVRHARLVKERGNAPHRSLRL